VKNKTLITITVVILSVTVCGLVLFFFFFAPQVIYRVSSPTADSECSAIGSGMTRDRVLKTIHKRTRPYFEDSYGPSRLVFERSDAVCTVDFDLKTGLVTGTSVSRQKWSSSLVVGGYE
jgi:hypothetical protein